MYGIDSSISCLFAKKIFSMHDGKTKMFLEKEYYFTNIVTDVNIFIPNDFSKNSDEM